MSSVKHPAMNGELDAMDVSPFDIESAIKSALEKVSTRTFHNLSLW
jgi:hypothetical protein